MKVLVLLLGIVVLGSIGVAVLYFPFWLMTRPPKNGHKGGAYAWDDWL
jgi:hypothetical protein